jgi:hypothetical protein
MRRIVFVFLIVMVVAVVALYAFLEFRVSEIVFVTDRTETWAFGREMAVRRLYNSNVDIDAFFAEVEQALINAEFTEDEIFAAALASGDPEFYPAFYFSTYNPDSSVAVFDFSAQITQEFAPNQTNFNFAITDLYLEVISNGPTISGVELRAENPAERIPGTPIISNDGRQLAVSLDNVSGYSFEISGTGTLVFSYKYNIESSTLFSSKALEEQLLVVNVVIEPDFGILYAPEPFSSLEDLLF